MTQLENTVKTYELSSKKLKRGDNTALFCLSGSEIRRRAAKGYADFLEDPRWSWQWYITLTFTAEIHPEQANKYFYRWIRKINEIAYGKHYRKHGGGVTWVRGLEFQRRGVIHFHALISGIPEDFNRLSAMILWEDTGKKCGFARIYPYKEGACSYISKYVSKGGELDIWVGKNKRTLDLFRAAI